MSKAIMISIKPKYVAKILNGEKTWEIRKSLPKCKLPIDVYIYCTKEDNLCCIRKISRDRYICGKDFDIRDFPNLSSGYDGKGKVVAKFRLCSTTNGEYVYEHEICTLGCMSKEELYEYLGGKEKYAKCGIWRIKDLEIFDDPKELSEFKVRSHKVNGIGLNGEPQKFEILKSLNKAPQSYCFVEKEN